MQEGGSNFHRDMQYNSIAVMTGTKRMLTSVAL
jgi:hypothetical protein